MKAVISAKNSINVMEVLEQLRQDLSHLEFDLKEYSYKIFTSKEVQEFIIAANIKNLKAGLRPDLSPIEKTPTGNHKSSFYERGTIYNRTEGKSGYKPSQAIYVDLYKTGFFYSSLKVRAGSSDLHEFSTDPKAAALEKVWGDILGISSEDLNELILMLRPKIIKFVKDKLRLKKK